MQEILIGLERINLSFDTCRSQRFIIVVSYHFHCLSDDLPRIRFSRLNFPHRIKGNTGAFRLFLSGCFSLRLEATTFEDHRLRAKHSGNFDDQRSNVVPTNQMIHSDGHRAFVVNQQVFPVYLQTSDKVEIQRGKTMFASAIGSIDRRLISANHLSDLPKTLSHWKRSSLMAIES